MVKRSRGPLSATPYTAHGHCLRYVVIVCIVIMPYVCSTLPLVAVTDGTNTTEVAARSLLGSWFDPVYNEETFLKLRTSSDPAGQLMKKIFDNQFPSDCRSRHGWVIEDLQETGLGTIISFQLAALLWRAVNNNAVLIIAPNNLKSKYFRVCDGQPTDGKYECLFQPISSCTRGNIGGVHQTFPSTRNVNKNIDLNWDDWIIYSAFLSRPSNYVLKLAADAAAAVISNRVFTGTGTGVHIRQGQLESGADWARHNKHIWKTAEVVDILRRVACAQRSVEFMVISDDPKLASDVSAQATNMNVFVTTAAVKHVDSSSDCVREKVLGCDASVGEVAVAKSVIVDLAVASRVTHVVGSMDSTYAWLLMGMIVTHRGSMLTPSDIFDLDNPDCLKGYCEFRHNTRGKFNHPTPPVTSPTPAPIQRNPLPVPELGDLGIIASVAAVNFPPPLQVPASPEEAESTNFLQLEHPSLDLTKSSVVFENTTGCPFCELVNANVFLQKIWLNQFPPSCAEKRAVVVDDIQVTGSQCAQL
jgi:hypothetical protein